MNLMTLVVVIMAAMAVKRTTGKYKNGRRIFVSSDTPVKLSRQSATQLFDFSGLTGSFCSGGNVL